MQYIQPLGHGLANLDHGASFRLQQSNVMVKSYMIESTTIAISSLKERIYDINTNI